MKAPKPPVRWVDLGLCDYWRTQAVYHALARNMQVEAEDTIIVCRPAAPYLCIGYHQEVEEIFDWDACRAENLPVLRRWVGGGATYLDQDQLFYQCVFHHQRAPASAQGQFQGMLTAPVRTLNRLGIPASLQRTNEIMAGGKRLAGTGGGRIEQSIVVVGNLLFDFNYEAMLAVWKIPGPGFRDLARLALKNHVGTLKDWGNWASMEDVLSICKQEFENVLGRPILEQGLSQGEEQEALQVWDELRVEALGHEQKAKPAHLQSRPLKIAAGAFIHHEQIDTAAGRLAVSFYERDQIIVEARIESGPAGDWQRIEDRLKGVSLQGWRETLAQSLE